MGTCLSKRRTNIEPSVPSPEKTQSSQPTSTPDRTTSASSPRADTVKSARVRAQSQGGALSQRRHDDGRDHPPPSSGDDVFTSQHLDHQEMNSRQPPSGVTGRMPRNRSVSMDVTASQSAPLQSPSRRSRTASTATGQSTGGRQGGRSRFPFALQSLLPNDFRYASDVVLSVHDC
jgi:hypothetical protein